MKATNELSNSHLLECYSHTNGEVTILSEGMKKIACGAKPGVLASSAKKEAYSTCISSIKPEQFAELHKKALEEAARREAARRNWAAALGGFASAILPPKQTDSTGSGSSGQSKDEKKDKGSNTGLYVGLGIGMLLIGATVVYFAVKSK
jgi:hypothetical protein